MMLTPRQLYWMETKANLKKRFIPHLNNLVIWFSLGFVFGFGAGKGFMLGMGI